MKEEEIERKKWGNGRRVKEKTNKKKKKEGEVENEDERKYLLVYCYLMAYQPSWVI